MSAPLLQVLINLEATVPISLEQRMSRVDFRTVNSFGKKEGDMHGMRREPVSSPCHVLINLKRDKTRNCTNSISSWIITSSQDMDTPGWLKLPILLSNSVKVWSWIIFLPSFLVEFPTKQLEVLNSPTWMVLFVDVTKCNTNVT